MGWGRVGGTCNKRPQASSSHLLQRVHSKGRRCWLEFHLDKSGKAACQSRRDDRWKRGAPHRNNVTGDSCRSRRNLWHLLGSLLKVWRAAETAKGRARLRGVQRLFVWDGALVKWHDDERIMSEQMVTFKGRFLTVL